MTRGGVKNADRLALGNREHATSLAAVFLSPMKVVAPPCAGGTSCRYLLQHTVMQGSGTDDICLNIAGNY